MDGTTWPTALAVLLAGLMLPLTTAGQAPPGPGDRVRIHQADGRVATGVLAATSENEVTLSGSGGELTFPADRISGLERSLGRHRRFGRTFTVTLAVAALAGGTVSAIAWTPCRQTGFMACFLTPQSRADAFAWGLAGGAVIGVPVGLILGLAVTSEVWEPVSLPSVGGVALSVRAAPGEGVGLVAALPVGGRP